MLNNDSYFNLPDIKNEMNTSYASSDLNGDGIDETFTQFLDRDGDGIAETTAFFEDRDVNGDGILDQTTIYLDVNNDGVADLTQQVDYIDPQLNPLAAENACFVGDLEDTDHWHWQGQTNDCAVVSQEMILDSFGKEHGIDFTQEKLVEMASANGWYDDGTPMMHMGSLLEAHGIPVEQGSGGTLSLLLEKLEQGEKIIVALDADEIWTSAENALWEDYTGDSIPGQDANHAVQVIGIDYSNPDSPMIVLNDPGHPEGGGMKIPAEQFMGAWDDSGNYIVATAVNGTIPEGFLVASTENNTSVPVIAGSHDRYGNWWWNDGTVEPGYNWETGYV